ncbi:MAG: hypothetical protein R3B47_18910 [Bacteroidia bacterium]
MLAVAYSPTNSTLTGPYLGGTDIRRSFADAFYMNPYYGDGAGRSMPSGFVNRRKFSTTEGRKLSVGSFASSATAINAEASPVNMGLSPFMIRCLTNWLLPPSCILPRM